MVATNTNGDQVEGTFICRDVVITGLENSSSSNSEMQQIDTTNSSASNNSTSGNTTDGQNSTATQNSAAGQSNNTVEN